MAHDVVKRLATTMQDQCRWILCAAAAFILTLNAGIEISRAAQVTFAFDAHVASVGSVRGGADLPFSVSTDDTLTATFTFEPSTGGPLYPQLGVLQFVLGGETLELSGYEIGVFNDNFPIAVPRTGDIAEPGKFRFGDQGPGSSDNISLSCLRTPAVFTCGTVPAHNRLAYRPSILLAGSDDLLSSTDLTATVAIWNSFTFREMSLYFIDTNTGGETFIGAYIGPLRAIPEPNTQVTMVLGAIGASLSRLCYRRRTPLRILRARSHSLSNLRIHLRARYRISD